MELHRHGATNAFIAVRLSLTPQRVGQIIAAGPPETSRHRGRPCPNVIDGERCSGSSRVLKIWQEDDLDAAVRLRKCVLCGHKWRTVEAAYEPSRS